MKIIVTGSTGFLGSKIVNELKKQNYAVMGASSQSTKCSDSDTAFLDISSQESCNNLFRRHKGITVVVHCAAIAHRSLGVVSDDEYYQINGLGAKHMINAAIAYGAEKFVLISSVSVYGEFDLPDIVTEYTSRNPSGPYGISKRDGEDFCIEKDSDIELYILRMTTLYDENWLFNIQRKVIPPIIGRYFYIRMDSKERRYSFCSNENAVNSVIWSIENRMHPGIYNIADGEDYCLDSVLAAVTTKEGQKLVLYIPKLIPILLLKLAIGLIKDNENIQSRYWKFFKSNRYATGKLRSTGFHAPPHLLEMCNPD